MRFRVLVLILAWALLAAPLAGEAQQAAKVPRVGLLWEVQDGPRANRDASQNVQGAPETDAGGPRRTGGHQPDLSRASRNWEA
jgi:hypothetical protein